MFELLWELVSSSLYWDWNNFPHLLLKSWSTTKKQRHGCCHRLSCLPWQCLFILCLTGRCLYLRWAPSRMINRLIDRCLPVSLTVPSLSRGCLPNSFSFSSRSSSTKRRFGGRQALTRHPHRPSPVPPRPRTPAPRARWRFPHPSAVLLKPVLKQLELFFIVSHVQSVQLHSTENLDIQIVCNCLHYSFNYPMLNTNTEWQGN